MRRDMCIDRCIVSIDMCIDLSKEARARTLARRRANKHTCACAHMRASAWQVHVAFEKGTGRKLALKVQHRGLAETAQACV